RLSYSTSDSLHGDNFYLEGDGLACQGVVEVDIHHGVVDGLDHAGHLPAGGIPEDDQQARLQLHIGEVVQRHGLDVLLVARAEAALGLDLEGALVASLEAEKHLLEAGEQAAVAYCKGCRGLAGGGVDHFAVGELEGEVEGYLGVLGYALDVGHVLGLVFAWGLCLGAPPLPNPLPRGERGLAVQAGCSFVVLTPE